MFEINGIDTDKCLCHELARVKELGCDESFPEKGVNLYKEPVLWCGQCMPVPEKYKDRWGKFNCFNPVQAEAYSILDKNPRASLVAASGTGTGKSTIAEMAIIKYFETVGTRTSEKTLVEQYMDDGFTEQESAEMAIEELSEQGVSDGKVLVLQPLKALAYEKSQDWTEKFPEYRTISLTSDDDLGFGAERNAKLLEADVVVCSYEMLDSMSRKPTVYTYLNKVGLLIVDEVHELSDLGRGGGLDGAITRFLRYRKNMGFKTQFIGLSATFTNTEDLKEWLEKFVPDVHIVYKDFSPIKAEVDRRISFYGFGGRDDTILSDIYKVANQVEGPVLAMILSKPSVRKVTGLLNEGLYGKGCARYHFADVDVDERHATEEDYRQNKFRFLIATPTLLAGVNLPCQAIVLDISYFNSNSFETDVLPIQKINQAKGRVGRLPYYNTGHVKYVCDGRVGCLAELRLGEQNTVRGTLFYSIDSVIVAEVNITPMTFNDLNEWYQLTFSKVSNDYTDEEVHGKLYEMINWLEDKGYICSVAQSDGENVTLMTNSKGSMAARLMVPPKLIEHTLEVLKMYENVNLESRSGRDNVFISIWSHTLSEVQMNANKLAALYKFNMEQASERMKNKKQGEYDWIKNIRVAIKRLTPFVEKYANLQQRKIWLEVCNSYIKNSVSESIASGWGVING